MERPKTLRELELPTILARILLSCLAVAIGVACQGDSSATSTQTPSSSHYSTVSTTFPLTVYDSNGGEVVFLEPPLRIVAYDAITVEILYAIGEEHRIAGTHNFVTYPPEVQNIPKLGDAFQPNTERIVDTQPDLVSIWFSSAVPELEQLGLKVLHMDEPTKLSEIAERIRIWGGITDERKKAELVAKRFEARVQELLTRLESLDHGPRIFHDSSDLFTPGPDTITGQVYSLLKTQNIAHDISKYAQLSIEVIVERDPQIIITTFPEDAEKLMGHPALKDVSAIKEGRIVAIEPGLISVAGPRYVEAMEKLARLIYPDVFT